MVAIFASGRPAVAAVHEFVAPAEAEPRVRAQIADRAQPPCPGLLGLHADGVGVVEAEGAAHVDAPLSQGLAQRLRSRQVAAGQDVLANGAGIFHIGVDLASDQGTPGYLGSGETCAVLCRNLVAFS